MAGDRQIRLRFTGDAAGLEAATSEARRSLNDVAESTDHLDTVSAGATSALGALSSGFELVGLEGYAAGLQSAALATDFFSGVGEAATLVLNNLRLGALRARAATIAHTVATKAQTVATRALNLAMRANPLGIVITLLAAAAAGLVVAYNKSETFRSIVQGAFRAVGTAASWVGDRIGDVIGWFTRLPGRVRSALSGIGSAITAPFRAGFNAIRSFWNNTIGGREIFSVPDWVPKIGGKSFSIPRLAIGGRVRPGQPYMVGELGRELFVPDRPGEVVPNNQLGAGPPEIHVYIGDRELTELVDVRIVQRDRRLRSRLMAGASA